MRLENDPSVRKVLLFGSLDILVYNPQEFEAIRTGLLSRGPFEKERCSMRLEPKRDQDLDDAKYCFQGKRFQSRTTFIKGEFISWSFFAPFGFFIQYPEKDWSVTWDQPGCRFPYYE